MKEYRKEYFAEGQLFYFLKAHNYSTYYGFHLAPKYVDGPDYGGVFQMNPGKVYLTDAEYQEMIEAIKKICSSEMINR